jgi:hypothetical protein
MTLVSLATDIGDPVERLLAIRDGAGLDAHRMADRAAAELQHDVIAEEVEQQVHLPGMDAARGDRHHAAQARPRLVDKQAARDLMSWFEKGYDFVLDAEVSPGEVKSGRYLVYVEMRRRTAAARNTFELLDDLSTLTEFEPKDWMVHYEGKKFLFSEEDFSKVVALTPDAYRVAHEKDLNEIREAAGLPTKKLYAVKPDLEELQRAAGI